MGPLEGSSESAAPVHESALSRWLNAFVYGLAAIAGAMLCILAALICIDVVSRYMRLGSLPWVFDLTEYFLYASTFAGAPWVLKRGGHISIDILAQALNPRQRKALAIAANIFSCAICTVLAVVFAKAGWSSFTSGTMVRDTFTFPEWILFILAPVVFVLMALIFFRSITTGTATAASTTTTGQ